MRLIAPLLQRLGVQQDAREQARFLGPVRPGMDGAALNAGIPGLQADFRIVEDQPDFA